MSGGVAVKGFLYRKCKVRGTKDFDILGTVIDVLGRISVLKEKKNYRINSKRKRR